MAISPFGILNADDVADLVLPAMLIEVPVNLSIPNATPTLLTITNTSYVKFDNDGVADPANHQGVATRAGLWRIAGLIVYANNVTGQRHAIPRINGLDDLRITMPATTGIYTTNVPFSGEYVLAVGDTVQFRAEQSSGGALDARLAKFSMHLIAASA